MAVEAREAALAIHRAIRMRIGGQDAARLVLDLGAFDEAPGVGARLEAWLRAEKRSAAIHEKWNSRARPPRIDPPHTPRPFVDFSLDRFRGPAAHLFKDLPFPEGDDTAQAWEWAREAGASIGRGPRQGFKDGRMDREMRALAGIDCNRRQYNRRFRFLRNLEGALSRADDARRARMRKFLLAEELSVDDLAADPPSSAYALFVSASFGQRSLFTLQADLNRRRGPESAMLACLLRRPATDWLVAAHADPGFEARERMEDWQRLRLVDHCLLAMGRLGTGFAALLAKGFDPARLEMPPCHRADEWNWLVRAWDRVRRALLACLSAWGAADAVARRFPLKMPNMLDNTKVRNPARLRSDATSPPEARVWRALPWGFRSLSGAEPCSIAEVESACRVAGIKDPEADGWLLPAAPPSSRPLRPTMEDIDRADLRVDWWLDWAMSRAESPSGPEAPPEGTWVSKLRRGASVPAPRVDDPRRRN